MEKTHFTADPPFLVGQRIRDERNKWNFTQEQLSEHLGISTNYLGQIERGRTFSRALAERICEFFHITYDYLYYGCLLYTSFRKRFPLTNLKAMLLPVNISAFWWIRKSAGSSTFSRIGPRAIWLIIGGTFPGKNA